MAVDLEAIRRRVQELSGVRRTSSVQLWKPGVGEYKVRGLPWKNAPEGQPFIERWFYYIGNGPGILAPHQFGKPDPINDLIRKLYSSGKPDDRLLAKKLQPKMRAYMPVIVRGQEDKGVQVWSFGKIIYQKLLGYFLNEEVGDILDPQEGFDLNVTIKQQAGKQFQDTDVEAARRPRKLADDGAQAKQWLEAVPNIDDMYRLKSPQEIETILNNWLSGGDAQAQEGDGTQKGASPTGDELDKLVNEVKGEAPKAEAPKAGLAESLQQLEAKPAKGGKGKKAASAVDEEAPVEKKSLDDAFAELMKDDE